MDKTYFASYAGGNTSYTVHINANDVVKSLEETSKLLIEWFKDEKMKLNLDKCYLVLSGSDVITINASNASIIKAALSSLKPLKPLYK